MEIHGWRAYGVTVLRIAIGVGIAMHGFHTLFGGSMSSFVEYVKSLGIPMPELLAYAAKGSELFGGIALALGLLTRVAASLVAATMFVAAFVAHAQHPLLDVPGVQGAKEHALLYLVASIALILTGAGPFCIDQYIHIGRRR